MTLSSRISITVTVLSLTTFQVNAQNASIEELFQNAGPGCLPTVKVNLVDAIRNGIDGEVKRQEAALKKPSPITSLGCLDNLMNVNLDIAIPVPDLQGIFNSAMSNAESQICSAAQEEFDKVTEPLQNAMQTPGLNGLNLPGGGGGRWPDLNFEYERASPGERGLNSRSTAPRSNDGTILNNLYQKLYGGGQ